MARVVVTGGSGKVGRACVGTLSHGYEVANVDTVPPTKEICPLCRPTLPISARLSRPFRGRRPAQASTRWSSGGDPGAGEAPNAVSSGSTCSTYNVFEAARRLKIRNVVWASSETVLGLPFDTPPPYVPVDEEYAGRPETAYSLSKHLGEAMAEQFAAGTRR